MTSATIDPAPTGHPRAHPPKRSGPRPQARGWIALLAALAFWLPGSAAAGSLGGGVEWISFRDPQIEDLYGSGLAPALEIRIWQWRDVRIHLGAAVVSRTNSGDASAFIDAAESEMRFVPLALRVRYRHPLSQRCDLAAGPSFTWAWFREEWSARVDAADLTARRTGTGSWLAVGGGAGVRWDLGGGGALRAGFDWMWAAAERLSVPGNEDQTSEMTGGWSSVRLTWELPWNLW